MPATDKAKSSYQQELERKANDLIRVYNPMDKRYVVEWDRKNGVKRFPVEAKDEAIFPRYIAKKYIEEMYQKILYDKAKDAILKENERRIKAGMAAMDSTQKTGEQLQFEAKFYNPSDEETKKIISVLYLGVESEFGIDRTVPSEDVTSDKRPTLQRVLEKVEEEKVLSKETEDEGEEKTEELSCDFPGCNFRTVHKIALFQHKKTHEIGSDEKKKKAVAKISK